MTTLHDRPRLGGMTVTRPPAPPQQWAPGYAPPSPASNRRVTVPTVIVGLVAVAALALGIVSLATRPSAQPVASPAPAPAAPTFTDAERGAAREHACTTFNSVARTVLVATTAADGPEPIATNVNARVGIATASLALGRAISPATPPDVAKAANTLADAYTSYLMTAFQNSPQNDADYAAMVDATHALRAICG